MTTAEVLERMVENDVPSGPVLELEEVFDDPQLAHNGSIMEMEHPTAGAYRQARPAARFHATPQEPERRMPPLLGATTGVNLYQIHRFEVVGLRDVFSAFTIQCLRLSSGSFCPL